MGPGKPGALAICLHSWSRSPCLQGLVALHNESSSGQHSPRGYWASAIYSASMLFRMIPPRRNLARPQPSGWMSRWGSVFTSGSNKAMVLLNSGDSCHSDRLYKQSLELCSVSSSNARWGEVERAAAGHLCVPPDPGRAVQTLDRDPRGQTLASAPGAPRNIQGSLAPGIYKCLVRTCEHAD